MYSADYLWELLKMGWLSNVPLAIGSIISIAVFFERLKTFRGLEKATRAVATGAIDALVARDLSKARKVCEDSSAPIAEVLQAGLRWANVAVEDLERVLATLRAEKVSGLRRGIWMIGIIRAFGDMATHGASGFAVVAQGISEALIATAAGLGVAIVALMLFNYLQVRVGAIASTYARACERLVQALIYVGSEQEGAVDVDLGSS
jgi:biopolymer transport protein ExbB